MATLQEIIQFSIAAIKKNNIRASAVGFMMCLHNIQIYNALDKVDISILHLRKARIKLEYLSCMGKINLTRLKKSLKKHFISSSHSLEQAGTNTFFYSFCILNFYALLSVKLEFSILFDLQQLKQNYYFGITERVK